MDDPALARCKDKLLYFRIKELKDILTELGLSKQGKKQDLVDRILAILSDDQVSGSWAKKNIVGKDEVAKLIDDTYENMQLSGAANLASKSHGSSDCTNTKPKEEIVDSYHTNKIRCICGSSLPTDSMIQCKDPWCKVWQHITCVVIPEKPMDGVLPIPPKSFYCELCRLSRADPFLVSIANPLYPVKLNSTGVPADGSNPGLNIEKMFRLTRADKDLLLKPEYDVQVWSMLLNDKVAYRMHWPQYADLQVNGVPVQAINRPGSQLLGVNGRDGGPIITTCTRDGINKISLTGCDARIFCVGVRIVKRKTLHQILNMIPKENEGEHFEDALARVRKCVGGGAATENADSDSDIEVVADFVPVNLRCPMSGLRMKIAGRFKPCSHMGCFDLEVFMEISQRSRKWQCPICLKNYSWETIIIDPYFNIITSKMRDAAEDVADIEVKPDGSWRAAAEGDRKCLGELGLWHLPDGTICPSTEAESRPKAEFKPVKQENGSDGHNFLKLGIRKNRNGCWEFNKADNACLQQTFKNNGQNRIPMSSNPTGGDRDGEDGSANQDDEGNLDFSRVKGTEYESVPLTVEPTNEFDDPFTAAPGGDAEVIVLTDSDEESEPLMSSKAAYNSTESDASGVQFPASHHGTHDPYYENPAVDYNTNDDEFGSNIWSLPPGGQGVPNSQSFGSEDDISDPLVDMQHDTLNCQSSINGYALSAETSMGSAALIPDPGAQLTDTNDTLVDKLLACNSSDPSHQILLSTKPSDVSTAQTDLRDQPDAANGIPTEDCISFRFNGRGEEKGEAAAANRLGSRSQVQPKDNLDTLANHAAFLHHMNGNRTGKTSRQRSDSPFSFPSQLRSVRPRLYLSIDSDSE